MNNKKFRKPITSNIIKSAGDVKSMSFENKLKAKMLLENVGIISSEFSDRLTKESDIDGMIKNVVQSNSRYIDRSVIRLLKESNINIVSKDEKDEQILRAVVSLIYYAFIERQIPEKVFENTSIGACTDGVVFTASLTDTLKLDFSKTGIITALCYIPSVGRFFKPIYEVRKEGLVSLTNEYFTHGSIYLYPDITDRGLKVVEFDTSAFEENAKEQYEKNGVKYKIVDDNRSKNDIYLGGKFKVHELSEYGISEVIEDDKLYPEDIESENCINERTLFKGGNKYIQVGADLYGPYKMPTDYIEGLVAYNYRVNRYENVEKLIHKVEGTQDCNCKVVFNKSLNSVKHTVIDLMTEDKLVDNIVSDMEENAGSTLGEKKEQLMKLFEGVIRDKKLDERYKNRVDELRLRIETYQSAEDIEKFISALIKTGGENADKIIDSILSDESNLMKMSEYKAYKDKCNEAKEEYGKIKKAADEINIEEKQREYEAASKEVERIKKEAEELANSKGLIGGYDEIIKQIEDKTKEKDEIQESIDELTVVLNDKVHELAPDSLVIKNMVEARVTKIVEEQERKERKKERDRIRLRESRECAKLEVTQDIKDEIVSRFKGYRSTLSENDIYNLMICLTQGYITMFVGEPGVGKTSMCKIINKVICGNKRSSIVTVNRGWTNKGDLVGYFNPITHEVSTSNREVYNAIRLLDAEGEQSKYPYYITLDEANLSPMEYYWCDFLGMADNMGDSILGEIDIGDTSNYKIPKTLRFIATLNCDATTEGLSPRMVDRAWIIKLNNNQDDWTIGINNEKRLSVFRQEDLDSIFGDNRELNSKTIDVLNMLKGDIKGLSNIGVVMSNRAIISMTKYINTALSLFVEDKEHESVERTICDYIICQKVLPKIVGYGENVQSVLNGFSKDIKNKYPMAHAEVSRIIQFGVKNMNNFTYFM